MKRLGFGVFRFTTSKPPPSEYSLQHQHMKMKSLMSPNHSKVAIIGGTNLSGVVLASFLARLSAILPDHVKIFDRNTKFNLEQYLPHFAFGVRDREDIEHYILKVLTQYHKFNFSDIVSLEPGKNQLQTLDDTYTYDHLIICSDPEPDWTQIPGLREALEDPRAAVCSCFNADSSEKIQNLLLSGAGEGRVVFYSSGESSRDALACVNAALLFKQRYGKKARELYFVTQSAEVFETQAPSNSESPSRLLKELLEKEGFNLKASRKLSGINKLTGEASFKSGDGNEKLSYDMLIVDAPHKISEKLMKTPLLNEKTKLLDFDPKTLKHRRFRNVFAANKNILMLPDRLPQSIYSCSVDSSEICRSLIEEMHSKFEGGLALDEEEPLKVYLKYPIFSEKGKVKYLEYTLNGEWKVSEGGRTGYWTEMILNPWMLSHFIPKGRMLLPKEYKSPAIFRNRF